MQSLSEIWWGAIFLSCLIAWLEFSLLLVITFLVRFCCSTSDSWHRQNWITVALCAFLFVRCLGCWECTRRKWKCFVHTIEKSLMMWSIPGYCCDLLSPVVYWVIVNSSDELQCVSKKKKKHFGIICPIHNSFHKRVFFVETISNDPEDTSCEKTTSVCS